VVFVPRERAITTDPLSFRELFGALFANKPLLAVLAGSLLGTGRFIVQAGGAVFVVIVYDDETAFSILGAGIIGGMVISAFVTPVIMKRIAGRTLILFTCFAGAAVYLAMYLVGFENLLIVTAFVFLTGLLLGVFLVAQTTMIADAVDLAEETTGIRNDGISFATLTFVTKVMSAFSVLIFGAFLVIAGYEEGVVVTPQMQQTVWIAITLAPAISCLLSAIPFFRYRLDRVASSTS
jgi:Na+/melibiose symporter-like transporter